MYDEAFIARFETKFEKSNGCWEWKASLAGKGYGQIKLPKQRRQEYAHRVAYEVYKGPIMAGQYVCHTCDNPQCVNPDHLFIGSCKDNLQDMKSKGRHLYGSRNTRSKLDDDKVRKIKVCLSIGMTQEAIAKAFGVSQIQISRINTGQRWAHVK